MLTKIQNWTLTGLSFATGSVLLVLMICVGVDVAMWSLFKHPMVALSELQWHFYGFIGMLGMSYTMLLGKHVRVDLFYEKFPDWLRKVIESIGILLFLIPLCVFVIYHSSELVETAIRVQEKSAVEGGLPNRWIPKSFIPLGAGLLIYTGILRVLMIWIHPSEGNKK